MGLKGGNMAIQQGDVRVIRVAKLPKGVKACTRPDKLVLAYGEASGHKHQLVEECDVYEAADGTLYLNVETPTTIRHEEHGPVTLPEGLWQVKRVREFDHLEQMAREVRD